MGVFEAQGGVVVGVVHPLPSSLAGPITNSLSLSKLLEHLVEQLALIDIIWHCQ